MEKKYKHLTIEKRREIKEYLNHGMKFKDIGKRIGKDQTTISKEVKKHAYVHKNGFTKSDECCPKLMKAPFVYNGCGKRSNAGCIYIRRLYRAAKAQSEYETLLVEAREGIPLLPNRKNHFRRHGKGSAYLSYNSFKHQNQLFIGISTSSIILLGALICQGLLNLSLENLTVILIFQKLLKRIVLTKILLRFVRKIPIFLLWKWIRLLAEQGEK